MIATIVEVDGGRYEIRTRLGGGWMFHGAFPTFAEACDGARRQAFSLRNARWDRERGWVPD